MTKHKFQALKDIQFMGATGEVRFSESGGPANPRFSVLNVRGRQMHDIGTYFAGEEKMVLTSRPQFYGGDTMIRDTISTHLKLGVVKDPPFVNYIYEDEGFDECPYPEDQMRCYSGLNIEIIDKLAIMFDFTYFIIEEPSGSFGKPVTADEGHWDGLIGMIMRKEIDMGLVAFGVNSARERVVDFSVAILNSGVVMATQEGPSAGKGSFDPMTMFKTDSFFFLRPFRLRSKQYSTFSLKLSDSHLFDTTNLRFFYLKPFSIQSGTVDRDLPGWSYVLSTDLVI